MKLNNVGLVVLSSEDMAGVRSLIAAKRREVVDIHATTDTRINAFVRAWEKLTGDDFDRTH